MSFETAIAIILTALSVMIAVVTLGIAALAIWGYVGLRDSIKDMSSKRVDEAMAQVLKKYPDAADIVSTLERLRVQAEFWDRMRNQAVTDPGPKIVEKASKDIVQVEGTETPLESIDQQVTGIEKYPGEGQDDAGDDGQSG